MHTENTTRPSLSELIDRNLTRKAEAETKALRLAAELAVLDRFDTIRRSLGHDYGNGQRAAELHRRTRVVEDLDNLLTWRASLTFDPDFVTRGGITSPELLALKGLPFYVVAEAFRKVGAPRLARIGREDFRHRTPSTRRTVEAWTRVAADVRRLVAAGTAEAEARLDSTTTTQENTSHA